MESSNGTVLLVGQNLFFLGKIEAVAEPLGFTVQRATTEPMFMDQYAKNSPALILVDLEGDESVWSQVLGDLAQSQTIISLEILYLKQNPLGIEGAKALVSSCAFQSVKELYLGRTKLGNDGLAQLCNGVSWPNLTALSLAQNGLDDKSAQVLAETKSLPKLITLDLYGNNISDEAVKVIRCSPYLKCLRALQVN